MSVMQGSLYVDATLTGAYTDIYIIRKIIASLYQVEKVGACKLFLNRDRSQRRKATKT